MINHHNIHFMSATEMARRIRTRELSPVELMESVISRIEDRNPKINAFVFTAYEEARERAHAAEQAVLAGENLGRLHGVPTAMKDLFDFKPGWISTLGGVPALAGNVATSSCTWVERMEDAGAIIVGKTNSPVLGFRGLSDNPLFGPTCNPFDTTRNSGGSSGGSAAAVADGMVPFAEGTDAGGSIRIPSSWCGVYGFKPSAGRVPAIMRPNAFGGTNPFVHEGMITRSVGDAALGLSVLSGAHPLDPFSFGAPVDFFGDLQGDVRNWRIAYSPDFGGYPVDPKVAQIVERAAHVFEQAGATVEKVDIDFGLGHTKLTDLFYRQIAIQNSETIAHLRTQGIDLLGEHSEGIPDELKESAAQGNRLKPSDVSRDQVLRSQVFDTLQTVLSSHQILLTPTVGATATVNATDGESKGPAVINGQSVDRLLGWCLTYLINMTGHPAASIPAGLTDQGLPVGLQIIGRRHQDGDVLTASAAFEDLQPWQHTYPSNTRG
ncbi:amidase [Streptomyces sp. NBC_00690]|uniref:amidase n=1 Tax=Streptomyces sp. NBC_00690 TaxID=2975808 RepID=UPI002E28A3CD|nr:amidase family protein [Streptomyces sp. NBC_00690]